MPRTGTASALEILSCSNARAQASPQTHRHTHLFQVAFSLSLCGALPGPTKSKGPRLLVPPKRPQRNLLVAKRLQFNALVILILSHRPNRQSPSVLSWLRLVCAPFHAEATPARWLTHPLDMSRETHKSNVALSSRDIRRGGLVCVSLLLHGQPTTNRHMHVLVLCPLSSACLPALFHYPATGSKLQDGA